MQENQIIVLNSITYAYRARDYLQRKGIRAYLERVPSDLRGTGCGYGIRVNGNTETAAQMLDSAGITVKSIVKEESSHYYR